MSKMGVPPKIVIDMFNFILGNSRRRDWRLADDIVLHRAYRNPYAMNRKATRIQEVPKVLQDAIRRRNTKQD